MGRNVHLKIKDGKLQTGREAYNEKYGKKRKTRAEKTLEKEMHSPYYKSHKLKDGKPYSIFYHNPKDQYGAYWTRYIAPDGTLETDEEQRKRQSKELRDKENKAKTKHLKLKNVKPLEKSTAVKISEGWISGEQYEDPNGNLVRDNYLVVSHKGKKFPQHWKEPVNVAWYRHQQGYKPPAQLPDADENAFVSNPAYPFTIHYPKNSGSMTEDEIAEKFAKQNNMTFFDGSDEGYERLFHALEGIGNKRSDSIQEGRVILLPDGTSFAHPKWHDDMIKDGLEAGNMILDYKRFSNKSKSNASADIYSRPTFYKAGNLVRIVRTNKELIVDIQDGQTLTVSQMRAIRKAVIDNRLEAVVEARANDGSVDRKAGDKIQDELNRASLLHSSAKQIEKHRIQFSENLDSCYYIDGGKLILHSIEPHKKIDGLYEMVGRPQSKLESLQAKFDKLVRDKFWRAGTFKPRKGEQKDAKTGGYWRTMRDKRKILFFEGENVEAKLTEWWNTIDWKTRGHRARARQQGIRKKAEKNKQPVWEFYPYDRTKMYPENLLYVVRKMDYDFKSKSTDRIEGIIRMSGFNEAAKNKDYAVADKFNEIIRRAQQSILNSIPKDHPLRELPRAAMEEGLKMYAHTIASDLIKAPLTYDEEKFVEAQIKKQKPVKQISEKGFKVNEGMTVKTAKENAFSVDLIASVWNKTANSQSLRTGKIKGISITHKGTINAQLGENFSYTGYWSPAEGTVVLDTRLLNFAFDFDANRGMIKILETNMSKLPEQMQKDMLSGKIGVFDINKLINKYYSELPSSIKQKIIKSVGKRHEIQHTIRHEIAHAIWHNNLTEEQKQEWIKIVDKYGSPSSYSERYRKDYEKARDEDKTRYQYYSYADEAHSEMVAQWYDPNLSLHEKEAFEKLKPHFIRIFGDPEKYIGLKAALHVLHLEILAAKGFQPKPGEQPHKDGYYSRSTETGKRYRIKKGESVEEASGRMLEKIDTKAPQKTSGTRGKLQSRLVHHSVEMDRLKKWTGKDSIKNAPLESNAKKNPKQFYDDLSNAWEKSVRSFFDYMQKLYKETRDDDDLTYSDRFKLQYLYAREKLLKYPGLENELEKYYSIANDFFDHFAKLLDASPTMFRGTHTDELDNMLENSKIGGSRDTPAYFSVDSKQAASYVHESHGHAGVLLEFNTKGIDLKEHVGKYHEDSLFLTLDYMAGNLGVPLESNSIDASSSNLTIHIRPSDKNEEMIKKYSKLGKVKIHDF